METGKMKFSKALPHLIQIAIQHNLKLHYVREYKIARMLLAIRHR